MGKFKRFCMIVFVVAAVLGIGVLDRKSVV